ncbi:hypothetical protein [Cystobacter fuscus]|uniref:hypothetical protein n=1 Tax=Cystobacter fuscus TaxID=43 RepID=UPI002B2B5BD7|nr:hypothetical protein F0U63_30180 [Cystobacter fuscus]
MRVKILGGLLAMGLLSAGCGGSVADVSADAAARSTELTSQEQALAPTCAPGYTAYDVWDCERMCTGYGNALNRYCYNGTDEYFAGNVLKSCGACY